MEQHIICCGFLNGGSNEQEGVCILYNFVRKGGNYPDHSVVMGW